MFKDLSQNNLYKNVRKIIKMKNDVNNAGDI